MATRSGRPSHDDYTVACICPMGVELAAVQAMLDDVHESLPSTRGQNGYTLGRIGSHNIVVAVMPETGNNKAGPVARQLLDDFRSIRFGLLVGIGGGTPGKEEEDDIRLGDVVVSKPTATFGGVVQYDMGKVQAGGRFERTGTLRKPPAVLSANVQRLQAQHALSGSQITNYLTKMLQKYPNMAEEKYTHQGPENDQLFEADYLHEGGATCRKCDSNHIVERADRRNTQPRIHYGTIGSGNMVIKDGTTREQLRKELGVLCVEMEAAGLMDEFSCLVIRGICDYADSHKNKRWQPYAAATAAAYMKELLYLIPTQEVRSTLAAAEALQKPRFNFGLNITDAPDIGSNLFVGREKDLERLNDILSPDSTPADRRVVILGGLGGMGKTQLAITYAKLRRTHYDSVFWLNASSKATLQQSLRSLAARIGILTSTGSSLDDDQICTQISSWLSEPENRRWLLIFDNYDEPDKYDIKQYFPDAWQGSIIITTRSPEKLNGNIIPIRKLDHNESIQILRRRSERNDVEHDSGLQALASRLDGLPLALATAGSFLKQSSMSFRQYLDKYNEKWHVLRQTATDLPEYRDRTLYITWDLSFEQVQQQDRHRGTDAASLLRLLAYLDHQDVWYELLHAGRNLGRPTWFVNLTTDRLVFENAMRTLAEFCLVEAHIATESYSLHTCVHDWTLSSLNQVVDAEIYDLAFRCVRESIDTDTADEMASAQNRRLVPHAIRLDQSHFHILLDEDKWVGKYHDLFWMAWLLKAQGKFIPAENMYIRALRGYEKVLGPEHISTLGVVSNLGILYWNQGKMAKAEEMYIRALRGSEKASGPDDITTLNTVNNLGLLYRDQGKIAEAEKMYIQALRGREKVLGPEHTSTLNTVNNLGILYRNQGKMAEAEKMYIRALRGKEKALGPEHTSTLETVNNLGVLYWNQRKMAEAEEMYMRALQGYEKALGPEHISTLGTVNNLGILYRNQGKMAEAEKMYIWALRGREKALGPEHTSTLETVNNLGVLYRNQRKMAEAKEMYIRALRGREKVLGPEHTSTLDTVNNLGLLYLDQGKINEAEEMYMRALQGYKRAMGPEHYKTQTTARNLDRLRQKFRFGNEQT